MADISRLGCGESPLESTGVHMEYGGDRQELKARGTSVDIWKPAMLMNGWSRVSDKI